MDRLALGFLADVVHEASAAAVARVLEAHEHEIDTIPLARNAVPAALASGEIDLFASAWLPLIDANLLDGRMQPLGLLYRPFLVWCAAGSGLRGIGELASNQALERRIVVPASGPVAMAAERVLDAYALGETGYALDRVSDAEALAWAEAMDPSRVVPLCQPHPLLHDTRLRALEDPQGALGPAQEARLLIRGDLRHSLDPDLLDELDELTLGNKVVSAMAHAISVEGWSAEAAADAWQRGKLTPRG